MTLGEGKEDVNTGARSLQQHANVTERNIIKPEMIRGGILFDLGGFRAV